MAKKARTHVTTKKISSKYIRAVLKIENRSFEFPWSANEFVQCLFDNGEGKVALIHGRVAGFVVYKKFDSEIEILNIAVAKWARKRGVGTKLVRKLIKKLTTKRWQIRTKIRESNSRALRFFKKQGFRSSGEILHNQYVDTKEDAFVVRYQRPIDDHMPKKKDSFRGTK